MQTVTGLLAAFLIFLAGPYRTLQVRRPASWGRRLPLAAHTNVGLAAIIAVLLHIRGEFGISVWLFLATVLSGFYGIYGVAGSAARRRWHRFHRILHYAFLVAVLPHVLAMSAGWTMLGGVASGWAVWRWRGALHTRLSRLRWPVRSGVGSSLRTNAPTR